MVDAGSRLRALLDSGYAGHVSNSETEVSGGLLELAVLEAMLVGFNSPAARRPSELLRLVPEIRSQIAVTLAELDVGEAGKDVTRIREYVKELAESFEGLVVELA